MKFRRVTSEKRSIIFTSFWSLRHSASYNGIECPKSYSVLLWIRCTACCTTNPQQKWSSGVWVLICCRHIDNKSTTRPQHNKKSCHKLYSSPLPTKTVFLCCCCSRHNIWLMYCCNWERSSLPSATQTFTEHCSCSQTVATHQSVLVYFIFSLQYSYTDI